MTAKLKAEEGDGLLGVGGQWVPVGSRPGVEGSPAQDLWRRPFAGQRQKTVTDTPTPARRDFVGGGRAEEQDLRRSSRSC